MALSTSRTVLTQTGINTFLNYDIGGLNSAGIATFSNFKTGLSNVHDIGFDVFDSSTGAGATIRSTGNASFTGIVTAAQFIGSGSGLTGVASTDHIKTSTVANFSGGIQVGSATTLTGNLVANTATANSIVVGSAVTVNSQGLDVTGVITATSFSGIDSDKISELNTEVETVDTGSDGHVKITTDGAERVRVTDDGTIGKVGINTAAPNGVLAVRNGDVITEINPFPSGNKSFIGNRSNHPISLQINAAEVIKINSSGKLLEPHNSSTHFSQHAVGVGTTTTAGRNAGVSTAAGTLIYNTDNTQLQVYTGTAWVAVYDPPFESTGGTKDTSSRSGYNIHTFTSPGTFTLNKEKDCEVFVIGGGGGGGEGGGGAGALYFNNNQTLPSTPGSFVVTIGAGGGGSTAQGNPGNDSSIGPTTAAGGGGGGGPSHANGKPGGSGGGGRRDHNTTGGRGPASGASGGSNNQNSPSSGFGNIGGYGAHPTWCGAGGGGGAGGSGGNGSGGSGPSETSGDGGNGLSYSITGSSVTRAGGGGGGAEGQGGPTSRGGSPGPGGGGQGGYGTGMPNPRPGTAAGTNTGSGGGGTASTGNPGGSSHTGGPGIVIVAVPTS